MESTILKMLLEHGVVGVMLAWTNFMLWYFLKQYVVVIKKSTEVISNNTASMTDMSNAFNGLITQIRKWGKKSNFDEDGI